MTERFDLVVIGTGVAASTAAHKCRKAGWHVAVVDSRPYGGTCALRGCDPKKVLVGAAEAVDWARRMQGKGVAGELRVDWPALMAFKRSFTRPVPQDREEAFRAAEIETLHGRARFTDRNRLDVAGSALEGKKILIATGAKPMDLPFEGSGHLASSTEFLELDELPRRIAFVGGGYISFEFAHIAARAGAKATILHRSARPLKGFDPDLVDRLVEGSRAAAVEVRVHAEVERVQRDGDAFRVHAGDRDEPLGCDLVVHGGGRAPEIDDLDLDAAGVRQDHGVIVNEHLQSVSNPAVYAAGDAARTPGMPLTPLAGAEGQVAATNMLKGNTRTVDYAGTPSVVFTVPALARAGMLEKEAKEAGKRFEVKRGDMAGWYSYRRVASQPAAYKVLVEEGSGKILGAHVLGERAEELINVFALAIRHGVPAADLRQVPWAYPTHGSDLAYLVA